MNTKTFLALSLVLNVGLVGAWFLKHPPSSSDAAVIAGEMKTKMVTNVVEKTVPLTAKSGQAFDWRLVESEDYKKYIANLRSIGCPEETIKDIIVADVNKLFDTRRRALQPPGEHFQFWKSGATATRGPDEERTKQFQAMAKEKRELLRELLGVEVVDPQDALAAMTSQITDMLAFLPPDRQAQVIELEQRYAARLARFSGQTNETAVASTRALQAEKDAELNALLSPEERETYDLTTSHTASVMRNQLADFNPNEQEFRDIYKARKKLDEAYRRFSDPNDPASRDGREAALLQAYDEIHKSIGDARWSDYRAARELMPSYLLTQIAAAEGIVNADALKVPDIRDAARSQILKLRADTSLSDAQRQAAGEAIQAEARAEIVRVLGSRVAETPAGQKLIHNFTDTLKP